jgi:hypothetical protein
MGKLEQIALFFSTVPVGKCDIDIFDSSTWSSPWNIMADRTYSKSTVSILMEITCKMVNKSKSNIELVAIDDGSEKYLVPMINQHLVLNYNSGRVVTIEDINEQISILGHISTDKYRY